jgi:hypothetical protein
MGITYRLLEDLGKHQQEKSANKVDSSDSDVETVSLLVHPGAQPRDTDQ